MSIKEYRDQLYDNIIARRKQLRKAEKEKYGLTGKSDLQKPALWQASSQIVETCICWAEADSFAVAERCSSFKKAISHVCFVCLRIQASHSC